MTLCTNDIPAIQIQFLARLYLRLPGRAVTLVIRSSAAMRPEQGGEGALPALYADLQLA